MVEERGWASTKAGVVVWLSEAPDPEACSSAPPAGVADDPAGQADDGRARRPHVPLARTPLRQG